jgi:hypothetical protein
LHNPKGPPSGGLEPVEASSRGRVTIDSCGYSLGMAIPDYQSCMLPFLTLLGDGKEHSLREAEEHLATFFTLSDWTPVFTVISTPGSSTVTRH